MFMNRLSIISFCLLCFITACSSTTEPVSAPAGITQSNATIEVTQRPTQTATTQPTETPTMLTSPTITATPTSTPTPTATYTPTLQAFFPDAWVSGYFNYDDKFIPTASSVPYIQPYHNPLEPLTVEPNTDEIASQIVEVKSNVMFLLAGDFYGADKEGYFVIKEMTQVNLPYSEDTLLDETFVHDDFPFQFSYPAGWFITTQDDRPQSVGIHNRTIVRLDEQNIAPFWAYEDRTEERLGIRYFTDMTMAEYLASLLEEPSCVAEMSDHLIQQHTVTQLREACGGGGLYRYLLEYNGVNIELTTQQVSSFAERVISTIE